MAKYKMFSLDLVISRYILENQYRGGGGGAKGGGPKGGGEIGMPGETKGGGGRGGGFLIPLSVAQ